MAGRAGEAGRMIGPGGQCPNCYTINFFAFFGPGAEHPSIPWIRALDAIENEAYCPFCSLLLRATRQLTYPRAFAPRRNSPPYMDQQEIVFYFERECITGGGVMMHVRLFPPPVLVSEDAAHFKLCLVFTSEIDEMQHSGQFIAEDRIDMDLCRRWLDDCLEKHPKACRDVSSGQVLDLPSGFLVLDVVDECITELPRESQFIALSYVWGQTETLCLELGNIAEMKRPGSLRAHKQKVDKTILDAIEVVQKLGKRYLWVDRLCIIQNSSHRGLQIACMDKIYSAAVLTLAAADGTNANSGLRGTSSNSRMLPQIVQEIRPDLILAVSIASPDDPSGSLWASRGWTCQEQVLSKRLLLFLGGQVIWQCPSCLLCEDTAAESKISPIRRLRQIPAISDAPGPSALWTDREFAEPEPLRRPAAFLEYAEIVHDYTKRRLTFANDILRAFEGLGSVLQQRFNCRLLSGLPEGYLDVALLWLPSTVQARRITPEESFPSWSWAGWVGRACYEELENPSLERIVPLIKWYVSDESGKPAPVNDSLNTFSRVPPLESLYGRPPEFSNAGQTWTYLRFWARCSFFSVVLEPSTHNLSQLEESLRKPIKAQIRLPGNQLAGYLVMNGSQPVQAEPGRHEFVVLSEAQVSSFNPVTWDITYSDRCNMYNVMLVEWGASRESAYRLGIGRVFKSAWEASRPTVKLVTLG